MEFHAGIVFIGCIVVVILVVIFISLFGIREKTYEEAIAEQKRKAQEIALQSKSEKTVKEKKKKYTRKSKDKPEKSGDNEEEVGDHLPVKASSEELSDQRTKNNNLEKKLKQFNSLKRQNNLGGGGDNKDQVNMRDLHLKENREVQVEKEIIQEQIKSVLNTEYTKVEKDDKEDVKQKSNKVNSGDEAKAKEEAKLKNKNKDEAKPKVEKMKDEVKVDAKTKEEKVKEEIPVVKKEETQTVTSPAKKSKKQKTDMILGEVALNGSRLVSIVKNAMLTDVEIHTLIDVLLNKQQEGEIWMKPGQKIDPVSALKKQLQEKEQALADEHQLAQAANNKLKELRQELGNEKSRFTQVERSLREKLTSQQQEIQNMQRHYQHSHDQQLSEINALQVKYQQVQTKLDEDHRLAIQQLQEENQQLQHTITQLENEMKTVNTNEISRLELEIEQLRNNESQYQVKEAGRQQAQDELQNHVHQLTQHVQELENEKIQLNEAVNQLRQKEIEFEELQRTTHELQNLEADNNSLRSEIALLQSTTSDYEQKIFHLEANLKEQDHLQIAMAENTKRIQDQEQEVENLNNEKRALSDKIERITEELRNKENSIKEIQETNFTQNAEISRLQQEIEVQKQRNNELRVKNWKVVEALSLAEKSAEKKVMSAEQRILEKEVSERRNIEESMKKMFERIFPSIQVQPDLSFNDMLGSIEHEAVQLIASLHKSIEDSDCSRELAESKETQNVLNAQIQQYKSVLAETENMLTQLQKKVEEEEHKWKERLVSKEKEIEQLLEEKQLLKDEKSELEKSLEQVTSAEEAAAELQEKLKLLQQKLQGEENERRQLEVKYDEAFKNVSDLQNILNETQKELQEAKTEKNCVEALKKDLDEIQIQLETEKKVAKDLRSENVKLTSLVKIGQDSVNAEQDRVNALEKELSELKNRSTNGSPCQPTNHIEPNSNVNGNQTCKSSETPSSSSLKSKSKKRGASDEQQTNA